MEEVKKKTENIFTVSSAIARMIVTASLSSRSPSNEAAVLSIFRRGDQSSKRLSALCRVLTLQMGALSRHNLQACQCVCVTCYMSHSRTPTLRA